MSLVSKYQFEVKSYVLVYYIINFKKYLLFNKKKYVFLTNELAFSKNNDFLLLKGGLLSPDKFLLIVNIFKKCLKNLSKIFSKKLILKGLGLRVNLSKDKKSLELKLGFSHIITVLIPNGITVKINKNIISAYSANSSFLGNFLFKVKHLKYPNSYKGKGIWYKNETKLLKVIKKT